MSVKVIEWSDIVLENLSVDYNSLNHRRDNRSIDDFKKDLKWDAVRVDLWMRIFLLELQKRCPSWKIDIVDNAMGQDGGLIVSSVDFAPDKIITLNGHKRYLEVKCYDIATELRTLTIKIGCIKECVKKNAYIFIPNKNWWTILSPRALKFLDQTYPSKIYKKFSPNDRAVRIWAKDFYQMQNNNLVKKYDWLSQRAKKMINNQLGRLFKNAEYF
ncbi:MAG: hypothetical protein ACOC5T_02070 [Elusimicrobiota bacterium]